MRLRDVSLPALALCAAGAAGLLIPTAPLSVLAADRTAEPPAFMVPPVKPDRPAPAETVQAVPPATVAAATQAPAPAADGPVDRRVFLVSRGDTLMDLLVEASVPRTEASGAIQALREVYDPRRLQVGQQVTVLFEPRRGGTRQFVGLELAPDVVRSVKIGRAHV